MKSIHGVLPTLLALFVSGAAHAGAVFDTPQGKLSIGGDVELDMLAAKNPADATTQDNWDITGRILLNVAGERLVSGNRFASFQIQPLMHNNGTVDTDDAWFSFGEKQNWAFKVGRYEAYDMFPLGQDTFVDYGDSSKNNGFSDDVGYIYQMKEGRGRAGKGGQAMFSKQSGQWYAEVSTLVGESDNLFGNSVDTGTYHGSAVTREKDSFVVRPVVAWTGEAVSVAVGAETNLVSDAYVLDGTDTAVSERTGVGSTATWTVNSDLALTLRGAYLDAVDEKDFSVGPNMQYKNFFLSYIFANNDITQGETTTTDSSADIHTVYSSYKFTNVMDMDNFDMYLGAYWSQLQPQDGFGGLSDENQDRYGGKVRFKYFF